MTNPECPICHEPATKLPDGLYATNIIGCQHAHTGEELARATATGEGTAPDLLKFARRIFEVSGWPEGGDIDGGTIQDAAVECGLLRPETRYMPCGEHCFCAEYNGEDEMKAGITCYRKHPILEKHK